MKFKLPFWWIFGLKIAGSLIALFLLFYTFFSDNGRQDYDLKIKNIEKSFSTVKPEDLAGFWIEDRKANQTSIPYGDRTKFIFISRNKMTDTFRVKYTIDGDSVFTAPFVFKGRELTGSVPSLFGMVDRNLIFDGQDGLLFNQIIFLKRGH